MIHPNEFKKGYYYYAEQGKEDMWNGWRFIGKIENTNKDGFNYKVAKGEFKGVDTLGMCHWTSQHHKSIKGIARTIKELRVYMI